MTMNSPDALTQLFNMATHSTEGKAKSVATAELMREVALKCIGFNGVSFLSHILLHSIGTSIDSSRFPEQLTVWEPSAQACLAMWFRSSQPHQHGRYIP